jgi:hypothetical protein
MLDTMVPELALLRQFSYMQNRLKYINKKFWEELICRLTLNRLTIDNIQCHHLHTKFHPNPPFGSKVAPISEV